MSRVLRVQHLVQRTAAQTLNEPNRTIKLHNAGIQFVALRAVEAALHVIQDDESVGATTVMTRPLEQFEPRFARSKFRTACRGSNLELAEPHDQTAQRGYAVCGAACRSSRSTRHRR